MSEKQNRYYKRTVEHIQRVQKNMLYLITKHQEALELPDEQCRECMWNVMKHDQSKFSVEQFEPYVHLTEYYHQRKTLGNKEYKYPTEEIKKQVDAAVINHYAVENHHPERLKGKAEKMLWVELLEVVCDLQAMAQEFGEGSCRKYWEDVWLKKQMENFWDDWDWETSRVFMDKAIKCFEANT